VPQTAKKSDEARRKQQRNKANILNVSNNSEKMINCFMIIGN
jgi:hypothetical protein